ncbi:MAG: hypothetical protein O3A01_00595 [bacterium]|nr:hypothetical protein [bacterium]
MPPGTLIIRLLSAAWIGYYVYQQRKSPLLAIAAGVATFALPILAIVIVIFARERRHPGAPPKPKHKAYTPKLSGTLCSKCGHEATRATDTCPNCGNHLTLV